MKRWTRIIIVALPLLLLGLNAVYAEPYFVEGWESEPLASRWAPSSAESSVFYFPGHEGGNALAVGTEPACSEGLFTLREFETAPGLSVTFRLRPAAASPPESALSAGVTGAGPFYEACPGSGLMSFAASVTLTGQGIVYGTERGAFWEPYPDDSWHLFRIEMVPDGTLSFYRDDVLKFTTHGEIDLSALTSTRFQIAGRAPEQGPTALIDDIVVSAYRTDCLPDINGDGLIDLLDLQLRGEAEVGSFSEWYTGQWRRLSDEADFNADGRIDEQDMTDRSLAGAMVFMAWVEGCWSPALAEPEPNAAEEALRVVDGFRRVIESSQRRSLAIGW